MEGILFVPSNETAQLDVGVEILVPPVVPERFVPKYLHCGATAPAPR